MADSSRHSTRHKVSLSQLLPTDPHAAVIVGQTGCGKTVFCLDLLEGPYRGVFRHIVFLCPTILHNKTYKDRTWIWADPEVYVIDPGERLHDCLRALYQVFQGEPCLFLIDDCAATKALTKKKDMLSELAFSGRHAGASVWVLTQKFNAVGKDLREQTKWVALFHCEDCLRENDVIPTREERAAVRQLLAETKHAKLVAHRASHLGRLVGRCGVSWGWVLGAAMQLRSIPVGAAPKPPLGILLRTKLAHHWFR